MKRTDILKALAMLPVVGALLTSPAAQETVAEEGEVLSTRYAMMTSGGQYLETSDRFGWPTPGEVEDAAVHGFDRFEIWSNIRGVIYASPTRVGIRPGGWSSASLEQLRGYWTKAAGDALANPRLYPGLNIVPSWINGTP